MKKIKVYLRLGKRPHPIYYNLINFPPKNVIFKYPEGISTSSDSKISFLHKLKVKIWLLSLRKGRPPIIKINPHGCDLIHSTNNILNSGKTPWVMDVELLLGLFCFNPANLKKNYFTKVKKILSSKYCKALMPYTQAAKDSIRKAGLENLGSKMHVVYPTKRVIPKFKKQKNKIPKVLWAGSKFLEKGGKTVLEVFDKLNGKIKFDLIMLGPVPLEVKEKYKGFKNIFFIENKKCDGVLWKNFREADIFFYPTNLDSFGLAMIDAMNHKLPIIVSDMFSAPELVKNGKNGFVIKHPFKWHDSKFQLKYHSFEEYVNKLKSFKDEKYIQELADKLNILIQDDKLRKNMGKKGYLEVKEGKFSIKERDKKLIEIYRDAIQ